MEARAERMYQEAKAAKAAEKAGKIPLKKPERPSSLDRPAKKPTAERRGYTQNPAREQPSSPRNKVSFSDEPPPKILASSPRSRSPSSGGSYSPRSPKRPGVASKQELEEDNKELRAMLDKAKAEMREQRVTIKHTEL